MTTEEDAAYGKAAFLLSPRSTGLGSTKGLQQNQTWDKDALAESHVSAKDMGISKEHFDRYRKEQGWSTFEPEKEFKEAAKIFSGMLELAQRFYDKQPIYYDQAGLWWLWSYNSHNWENVDEVSICNQLYQSLDFSTINSKTRGEILQALKQIGRMNKPKDMPVNFIQFGDTIFDIATGQEFAASAEYFTVNAVPYKLHPDKFIETPNMDRIFKEWVGEKYVKTLYEILAFCLLTDYPMHRMFCFIGSGLNGKGCFLRLLEKFIGKRNVCSTELDTLLNSRFEITRLYKKLACIMGETNFNELTKTSILKKLTGQDTIGFEYKNKTPFEERNYAKILIATNNLPETTDKTIGFYRRWLIVDFPNQFDESKNILAEIPEEEFNALASKCALLILPDLLKERKFTNEGEIADRQKLYEDKSNPFDKFWNDCVDTSDPQANTARWEFEKKFNDWCVENRFRKVSDRLISQKMKEKDIVETKPSVQWFNQEKGEFVNRQVRSWGGIKWK